MNAVDLMIHEILEGLQNLDQASESGHAFEAFFSDLPSNDFNTLIKLLEESHKQGKPYFYSAHPGSFSEQLPKASIHFGMSSFALHWLSKNECWESFCRQLVKVLKPSQHFHSKLMKTSVCFSNT